MNAPATEDRKLSGQVAIVTGAGRGLGRELVRRLAAEGAYVAVSARSADQVAETVELVRDAGGRAEAFTIDVSDGEAVQRMVAQVQRVAGSIDLLVNNAAVIAPLGPVWEVNPVDWWRLMETNLLGTFLCARAVLPGMIQGGHGRIINVASGTGIESPPHMSGYVTSKAAVIRLSEELAMETQPYGLAVFAIDPGWMSTAMTDYLANSEQGVRWTPAAPSFFGTKWHVPTSRAADLVVALATGHGDALTGRFLTVYDDLDDLLRRSEQIEREALHRVRLRT